MTCLPKHYPDKCPPEDAYFYDGILYRFTNRNNPSARDFKSFYENDPQKNWGELACQARGLSVVKCILGIREMRAAIPALRKKKVSKAIISSNYGMLANTPSSSSQNHCTWWVPQSISEPEQLFTATEESELENV
jgi:hypothetical protein